MSRLLVAALVVLLSSSAFAAEPPAQPEQRRKIASVVDLEGEIQWLRKQVENQNLDGAGCLRLFSETYDRLWNSTPVDYAPDARSREELKKKGPLLIQLLFETRLLVRQRIWDLNKKGEASRECTNSARGILRASRFVEDTLGQLSLDFPKNDPKKMPPVLKGETPWLVTNPKFGKLELKTGDVLISRGNAFTSAAIARIAEADAQFSHAALIYVDEKTGDVETMEAHIEIGSIVAPLEKYLKDGKTRSVLFRHRDARLAAKAAKLLRQEILNYNNAHKDNYPYDFKMDETNAKEIFCSELIRRGFELASNGQQILPTITSLVNPRNPKFIQRLGIMPGETMLPGDMELDERFDLVAEWRDYTRMNDSHIHDAILMTMYDWMDRHSYQLYDSGWTKIKKHVVWNLRRWPLFSNLLFDKLPRNMSKSIIATVTTLNRVATVLQEHLI
ncbi:MAG: YiiX/YebB-like N1pC/P60 family cysteine hydrolase, partial [Bdellovibrionota bacterium]